MMHCWFDDYLRSNEDYDPISGRIHIPSYITHESFYDLFRQHCTVSDISDSDILSFFSFSHYFQKHFSHVSFLKHTQLGRCTFCMTFHDKCVRCTTNQELLDLKVYIIYINIFINIYYSKLRKNIICYIVLSIPCMKVAVCKLFIILKIF